MFLEDVEGGSLLTPIPDYNGRASDDFTFIAFSIELAKTSIFAQLHVVRNRQQGDLMFLAQSLDKLLVGSLVAVLGQDAQQSLK